MKTVLCVSVRRQAAIERHLETPLIRFSDVAVSVRCGDHNCDVKYQWDVPFNWNSASSSVATTRMHYSS